MSVGGIGFASFHDFEFWNCYDNMKFLFLNFFIGKSTYHEEVEFLHCPSRVNSLRWKIVLQCQILKNLYLQKN